MIGSMRLPLSNWMAPPADAPRAPFLRFSTLQITGAWCNLECVHCINASGPADPWLKPVSPEVVRRAIREAGDLGVKETSTENKRWLGGLPAHRRLRFGTRRVLMSHGSPKERLRGKF